MIEGGGGLRRPFFPVEREQVLVEGKRFVSVHFSSMTGEFLTKIRKHRYCVIYSKTAWPVASVNYS